MNKKFIYGVSSLMILSGVAFTSCQSDLDLAGASDQKVLLTVTANKEAATRTAFSPDGEGNLGSVWTAGDQLVVINGNGANLGVITLKEDDANKSSGEFSGEITVPDGPINLFYAGKGKTTEELGKIAKKYTVNITTQEDNLESLAKYDILSGVTTVETGNIGLNANVTLDRKVAEGYFNLALPNGVKLEAGDQVLISGKTLVTETTIAFPALGTSSTPGGTITVTKTADMGNNLYVTMLPCTTDMTFTVTKGGMVYTSTLGDNNWKAGEFVRANENGDPVVVDNWTVTKAPVDPADPFGVTWAPGNAKSYIDTNSDWQDYYYLMTYIPELSLNDQGIDGLKGSGLNFPDTSNAYAFQWGRDFGFTNTSLAYTGYKGGQMCPNAINLPLTYTDSFEDYAYYWIYEKQIPKAGNLVNYNTFVNPNNNDWCDEDFSSWNPTIEEIDNEFQASWPTAYRVPTREELGKLVPDTNQTSYKLPEDDFTDMINGSPVGGIQPFYAKKAGNYTIVWSLQYDNEVNRLDIRKIKGNHTLSGIDENIINNYEEKLQLPAEGYRLGNTRGLPVQGFYWAGDTDDKTGMAYAFAYTINESDVTINMKKYAKKYAFSLRLVKVE